MKKTIAAIAIAAGCAGCTAPSSVQFAPLVDAKVEIHDTANGSANGNTVTPGKL